MTRRGFRVLVVVYLGTWLGSISLGVLDTGYQVSSRLTATSWEVFEAASLVGLALYLSSAIGLFFFARWSRSVFCATWIYMLAYEFVYGSGSGAAIVHTLGTINILAAGAILCATFFGAISQEFRASQ